MKVIGKIIFVTVIFCFGFLAGKAIFNRQDNETASINIAKKNTQTNSDIGEINDDGLGPTAGEFSLQPATFNFGKHIEGVKKVKRFTIKNTGNNSINLTRLFSPCPCVSVNASKRNFGPGENGEITVTLHTGTLNGKKTFPFFVELMGKEKRILKGRVDTFVERIPAKVFVSSDILHYGSVSGSKEASFIFRNLQKTNLKAEKLKCSIPGAKFYIQYLNCDMDTPGKMVGEQHKVESFNLKGGEGVNLTVIIPAGLAKGALREKVKITTDCPEHKQIVIGIDGTVR